MNINFNLIIEKIYPYIVAVLLAYFINTTLFLNLPKSGVEYVNSENITLSYKKYDGFYTQNQSKISKAFENASSIENLYKYKLKAIYKTANNGGWISVEENQKSYILAQGEQIDNYILTKLYKNHVIFERYGKEYKLEMLKDNSSANVNNILNNIKQNITVKDDAIAVNRDYLNSYINNVDKIWNNIAITEAKQDGNIVGFKIENINVNSAFAKLGLQKGDVIKSINNNQLNSYADAFRVYNNINDTKFLNMEIIRNNETMELNYEIE